MMPSKNNRRSRAVIVIIALLVIAVFIGICMRKENTINELKARIAELEKNQAPVAPETQKPEAPAEPATSLEAYTNDTFGYSVSFPDQYQIKEYNSKVATIGLINGSGDNESVDGKADLRIISATGADQRTKLEDFMFNKVKLLCDADGGGVSVSCPKKISLEPLAISSKLPAYVLTLEQQEKTMGPEASTEKSDAVFYIIDLSSDKQRILLVIHPVGDGTPALARQIAETVKN